MVRALVNSEGPSKLSWESVAWVLALLGAVAPLWVSQSVPMVDLPQHLQLISALHRLHDNSTLYPELLAQRPEFTPYLGYYYAVSLLNWLLPLELANRVFLSAYVIGLPLSLAFLLRSLQRPTWPALLSIPFAYGDNFGWGFVNYLAAMPLGILTCAFFVRAIADAANRKRWAILLGLSLFSVLAFHIQIFIWLAVALPFLLLTTPAPEGTNWRVRIPALLGVTPAVLTSLVWIGMRLSRPAEIAPGQPWKAWGPMFSDANLAWVPFEQNRVDLITTLGNMLSDRADMTAVLVAFALAAFGIALQAFVGHGNEERLGHRLLIATLAIAAPLLFFFGYGMPSFAAAVGAGAIFFIGAKPNVEGRLARFRMLGLLLVALALFFWLPFDIRGFVYRLNTRFSTLAAALAVCCVPAVSVVWNKRLVWLGVILAALTANPLMKAFREFDSEMAQLNELVPFVQPKPRVMGLIFNTASKYFYHPMFIHASAVLARERGGIPNFSFASTPHSPLMYPNGVPPTFPSEWNPQAMNWEREGKYYDTFLVRGVHPQQFFGPLMGSQVELVKQSGDFFLVKRLGP